ncbi:Os04g0304750, partial [Oryza sativa Japonica Group]
HPSLLRPPSHLLHRQEDGGATRVAVLPHHLPRHRQLPLSEAQPLLHAVHYRPSAGVQQPERLVVAGDRRAYPAERALDHAADGVGDVERQVAVQGDHHPFLLHLHHHSVVRAGYHVLRRPDQLEHGALAGGRRVAAATHHGGASGVAEHCLGNEVANVGLRGPTDDQRHHLGCHHEHPGVPVALGDVLGHAQRRGAAEAAGLVEHDALGRQREAEELDERDVSAGQATGAGGGEHDVRDARRRLPPVTDGVARRLCAEPRYALLSNLLPYVERGGHVRRHRRVGPQPLVGDVHVPLL